MAFTHTIENKVEAAYRCGDLSAKRAENARELGRVCGDRVVKNSPRVTFILKGLFPAFTPDLSHAMGFARGKKPSDEVSDEEVTAAIPLLFGELFDEEDIQPQDIVEAWELWPRPEECRAAKTKLQVLERAPNQKLFYEIVRHFLDEARNLESRLLDLEAKRDPEFQTIYRTEKISRHGG